MLSLTRAQGNCRAEWRGDRDAGRQPSSLYQVLVLSRSRRVLPQALRHILAHMGCGTGSRRVLGIHGGVAKKNSRFFLIQSLTWSWVDLYIQSVKSPFMRPWLLFVCSCKVCQGAKALQEKIRGWGCVILVMPRTQKMILKLGFGGHHVSNEKHFN